MPARWHRLGLRRTLLAVLSIGIGIVLAGEQFLAWRTVVGAANAAYDRSLLGAIKSIDSNISTASGGVGVELPYRMLEFFQLTASGPVYFRVFTEDGLVEIGDAGLPRPPKSLPTGRPRFENTTYFGTPVRMGSYARMLDRPVGGQARPQRVVIQVAETLASREQFIRELVRESVGRDLLLALTALALLAAGVRWSLGPLARLRAQVLARSPQDLAPVATDEVPADLRPLVDAINAHIERTREVVEERRRFIDDASHQLRTPLATLATQVGFGLRTDDPRQLHEVLEAVQRQLAETVRQANQMLALARADSAGPAPETVDLAHLVGELTRAWWPEARTRAIDLGLEAPDHALQVQGHPGLLREAVANLLHNAIRYTPEGGEVTVRVEGDGAGVRIAVSDNGPGIPAGELHRAGERFFRASNASAPGTGLGLAIVATVARQHGGRLVLGPGADGRGLRALLELPLAQSEAQALPG